MSITLVYAADISLVSVIVKRYHIQWLPWFPQKGNLVIETPGSWLKLWSCVGIPSTAWQFSLRYESLLKLMVAETTFSCDEFWSWCRDSNHPGASCKGDCTINHEFNNHLTYVANNKAGYVQRPWSMQSFVIFVYLWTCKLSSVPYLCVSK